MPSVLFLSFSFQPEPGNVKGLPIARWLRDHGYDVKVLTGFPQYPIGRIYPGYRVRWRAWEEMDGVRVLRVPIYPSHDLSVVRRFMTYTSFASCAVLAGFPAIGGADAVFTFDNTPTTITAARLYALLFRAKLVVHIADLWPDTVLSSGMLRRRWLRTLAAGAIGRWMSWLYRSASVITVLSPGFKRILSERGVPPEKIELVYNSAEEDKFFPVEPDPALAASIGIDRTKFNVLYAGNIGPVQALDVVVRAAARLADDPSIRFVIIGTGPHEARLKALAGSADNVQFIERQPLERMNAINALAGALLIHLRDEAFLQSTIPGKTQASLASGRPILIGVRGDAADLVIEAGAGFAFEPDHDEQLAAAVRHMAAMPTAERERMGAAGREYYLRRLSTAAGAAQMDAIFTRLRNATPCLSDLPESTTPLR